MAGLVPAIHVVQPKAALHTVGARSAKQFGHLQAEPLGWPGIGRSEERPSFDGLSPAMTENDMEITG